MAEKYLMLSLDDNRIGALADALNNKTCKKILSYLVEKEATETEISRALGIPANTVNYDMKKLLDAELIEKSNDFYWSVKGKKMPKYKVSKKTIIISPKIKGGMRNLIIAALLTGVAAFFVKIYSSSLYYANKAAPVLERSVNVASSSGRDIVRSSVGVASTNVWIWFLLGGLVALLIYLLLSWKRV